MYYTPDTTFCIGSLKKNKKKNSLKGLELWLIKTGKKKDQLF